MVTCMTAQQIQRQPDEAELERQSALAVVRQIRAGGSGRDYGRSCSWCWSGKGASYDPATGRFLCPGCQADFAARRRDSDADGPDDNGGMVPWNDCSVF